MWKTTLLSSAQTATTWWDMPLSIGLHSASRLTHQCRRKNITTKQSSRDEHYGFQSLPPPTRPSPHPTPPHCRAENIDRLSRWTPVVVNLRLSLSLRTTNNRAGISLTFGTRFTSSSAVNASTASTLLTCCIQPAGYIDNWSLQQRAAAATLCFAREAMAVAHWILAHRALARRAFAPPAPPPPPSPPPPPPPHTHHPRMMDDKTTPQH